MDTGGIHSDVNLLMTPHAEVGDYLIIHAGFAIEVLNLEEANIRLDLFREIAAVTADLEDI